MATQKENVQDIENKRLQNEVNALKEDMQRLREDIAALTRALGETAGEYKNSAQEELLRRAQQAQAQAAEQLEKAQEAGQKVVEDMEVRIVERPFMSLLTAAGIGFVLAKLLDVRSRH
jgi:ElaB/YqjD/DUF883 family membrane-anchored ribosome-binding protein